jgi:hypothetical protein
MFQQVEREKTYNNMPLANCTSSADKGKVVPVLLLTEHHAMKAYWGVEV